MTQRQNLLKYLLPCYLAFLFSFCIGEAAEQGTKRHAITVFKANKPKYDTQIAEVTPKTETTTSATGFDSSFQVHDIKAADEIEKPVSTPTPPPAPVPATVPAPAPKPEPVLAPAPAPKLQPASAPAAPTAPQQQALNGKQSQKASHLDSMILESFLMMAESAKELEDKARNAPTTEAPKPVEQPVSTAPAPKGVQEAPSPIPEPVQPQVQQQPKETAPQIAPELILPPVPAVPEPPKEASLSTQRTVTTAIKAPVEPPKVVKIVGDGFEATPWVDPKDITGPIANDLPGVTIETYYEKPESEVVHGEPVAEESAPEAEDTSEDEEEAPVNPLPPYKLQIGDKLQVSVYGEPNTKKIVTVDPTGSISYLFIKSLFVLGKTINEVRREVEEKLKTFYLNALVVMTPIEMNGAFFTIVGEVNAPGKKFIRGKSTVLSALCEAKGLTTRLFRDQTVDRADLKHSFVARDGDYVPVDFVGLVRDGDMTQDVNLLPGDYIMIMTQDTDQVYILGEVSSPMTIQFYNTMSLAEAIAFAGGVTYDASSRVAVIRGSLGCPIKYLIDINRIFKGFACDFQLEPGDIVYVPPMKFTTLKQIIRSGIRAFVGSAFSVAGTNAFIGMEPGAGAPGSGIIQPVPTINTNPPIIFQTTSSGGAVGP